MLWPFKKKMSRYDELRKNIGMAPAKGDDSYDAATFIIVGETQRPEVVNECNNLPVEEREIFLLVYATYITWLTMTAVKTKFPPNSWYIIEPLIRREFSKKNWYKPALMESLMDALSKDPPTGGPGYHTGINVGPWTDVVVAASMAGISLSPSVNLDFDLFVTKISSDVLETIGKIVPK